MKPTLLCAPFALAAALVVSGVAFADGPPQGGTSSGNISATGRANTNGPNTLDRDLGRDRAIERANPSSNLNTRFDADADVSTRTRTRTSPNGGESSDHISADGKLNTNGPNATDRSYGNDRADQRQDRIKKKPD